MSATAGPTMDELSLATSNEQLCHVLLKNPENRSYDDLLVLKGFITRTEFMQKNLAGIVNPKQMNDLCRQLGLESYNAGDTVFNQGDIGDKVFILLEGACDLKVRYRIDLTQGESEIREKFIKTYRERGSYFGERALQFDEPRSGTVVAAAFTRLVTVNKNSYIAVIKEARLDSANEVVASAEQLGTKESVITVLSKMRDKRSNQELDAVAGYLFRRIPFFQRFTMPQLIELCRVAETVSVWGRSILFKQGSVGQAFYVVLSGTVEVWVNNSDAPTNAPTNRIQHKAHDVTDGLGVKVNQLVSGEIFGERALENEDSLRMASIVTGEGNTELIIISREDYHNLVYVMMHADSMNRLTLLRKTDVFRTVDVQHLKSLARFMEPRKYQLNEVLYKAGSKALDLIIIESGECRVETEIREGFDQAEQEELERLHRSSYLDATASHPGVSHEDSDPRHRARSGSHSHGAHHGADGHGHGNGNGDGAGVLSPDRRSHTPFGEVSKSIDTLPDIHAASSSANGANNEDEARPKTSEPAGKKRKFSLPKLPPPGSFKAKPPAPKEKEKEKDKEKPKPVKDPANSVAAKLHMKRLQTQQMIPLGRTHRINLGRIAPNSVLGMYVTTGSLADDVFHPETVIASTLVHAYTIGKHDFFNHLPKDTRFAIEKIIAEYKPPELTSLWQSNPKKMDEDLWRKEKAWRMFKHDITHDHRLNSNILDAYKKLEVVHLSANSGNDRYTTINLKNQALMQARDLRVNGSLIQVDADWGLKPTATGDGDGAAAQKDGQVSPHPEGQDAKEGTQGRQGRRPTAHRVPHVKATATDGQAQGQGQQGHGHAHGHGQGHPHYVDLHEKLHADIEADELAHPLHRHTDRGPHLSTNEIVGTNPQIISSAVSHMIRNRLNHAHFGESKLKKELFSIHTEHASTLTMETMDTNTHFDETAQLLGGAPDHGAHAFCLVQMHRESSRNVTGGLLDAPKRMVRCYMRLCGACDSTNAAKKLADAQMENIYLTLFRSDPEKEKELLLNWTAFKGYDSVSLSDTDHFLIFCRGAPILFASFSPSRNIFNCPFPALCKSRGQRYACIVVNKLNPLHGNKSPAKPHHHHHHHGHHVHHSHHGNGGGRHHHQDLHSDSTDSEDDRRGGHGRRNGKHGPRSRTPKPDPAAAATLATATDNGTSATAATTVSGTAPTAASALSILTSTKAKAPAPIHTGPSTKSRSNTEVEGTLSPSAGAKPSVTFPGESANATSSASREEGTPVPSGSSEYLLEFSVLNEVLLTCGNRMECLKYAITRFGTMTEPSADGRLTTGESEGRVGAKGKIYIRPFNATHPDRVLAMLHNGKRVCVVPLFNWVLINDETMRTLDFTNGFNHAAQQLVFMEEEMEHSRLSAMAFGGLAKSVVGSSSVAHDQVDTATPLFKSFAEVGMLHSDHQVNEDNSRYMPKNDALERHRVTNERTLQLLERDLLSKEMSQSVIKHVTLSGTDLDGDGAGAGSSNYEGGKRVSAASATISNLASGLRSSLKSDEAQNVEARLKALTETVSSVDRLMGAHDKLCESEHNFQVTAAAGGVFHGPLKSPPKRPPNLTVNVSNSNLASSTSTPHLPSQLSILNAPAPNAAVAKHNSLARTKELIEKRMNVIESLQNLKFQRVTLDNVVEGYNARVNREIAAAVAAANQGAQPVKRPETVRTGKPVTQVNLVSGNLNFIPSPAALGTVSVGKRLSDSIQHLSDSMAAKLK